MRGIFKIGSIYLATNHEPDRETYVYGSTWRGRSTGGLAHCFPLRKLVRVLFGEPPDWIQFALDDATHHRVATLSICIL